MSWVVTCSQCGKAVVYQSGQGIPEVSPACAEKGKKEVKKFFEKEQKRKELVAVGSFEFAQRKIKETLALVSDEQILMTGFRRKKSAPDQVRGSTPMNR